MGSDRSRTRAPAGNQQFLWLQSRTGSPALQTGGALSKACCFVSVNTRGLMGFHDYPPRLDTANLPHIPVCRWRILMESEGTWLSAADLGRYSDCRATLPPAAEGLDEPDRTGPLLSRDQTRAQPKSLITSK